MAKYTITVQGQMAYLAVVEVEADTIEDAEARAEEIATQDAGDLDWRPAGDGIEFDYVRMVSVEDDEEDD